MMGRRKIFHKTDLSTPEVSFAQSEQASARREVVPLEVIPPAVQAVTFPPNPTRQRSFSFTEWYGQGIDTVAYACQRQIERFLDKQDADVEPSTVVSYCKQGLSLFLGYLHLRHTVIGRDIALADIDRELIDGYLGFLRDLDVATPRQASAFYVTKSVLKALCRRGLIAEVHSGDGRTFPINPFPGSSRKLKGEKSLSKAERNAFSAAVKKEALTLFLENVEVTGAMLVYALLVVALHTGRNTTPLLELTRDCLVQHPKDATMFLVVYKRRGHTSHKVALRAEGGDQGIEAMPSVRTNVVRLLRRVIELSDRLRDQAPEHLRGRIWLYRAPALNADTPARTVCALTDGTITRALGKLVKKHNLVGTNNKPLRINISRLRKTFVNRVFDILEGDVVGTAIAAGNTAAVVDVSYLRPGEDAQRNWKFLGQALVQELLNGTIGATERTPVGHCSDTKHGEYAPKRDGAVCMSFFNCLRCRNYVVTGDDLYKLFSFYWRILRERPRMDKRRWSRQFSHITRLIDRDVVEAGLAKGIFKKHQIDEAREWARDEPHPFWRSDTIISELNAIQ